MHNPMHITGISAFSTVFLKSFIQSTLVKTQSLNIRIYSDKKNNYFYYNVHITKNSTGFEKLPKTRVY